MPARGLSRSGNATDHGPITLAASLHWHPDVEDVFVDPAPLSWRCRILIAGLSAVSLAACRPLVMTPAARKVAVASAPAEVVECKPRGKVFALAPFRDGQEPLDQLKIRAEVIGADTLLVARARDKSAQTGDWQARAYRCGDKVAEAAPAADVSAPR